MDLKQGVSLVSKISRSIYAPQHSRDLSSSVSYQEHSPKRQTESLKNSIYAVNQMCNTKQQFLHANTSQGFYPTNSDIIQQKQNNFQKPQNLTQSQSPQKKSKHSLSQASQPCAHPIIPTASPSQNEDLLRKIQHLQDHIQELNQDKNMASQEKRQLAEENQYLQSRVCEIQLLKNQEIRGLVHQLKMARGREDGAGWGTGSRKNMAYTEEEEEQEQQKVCGSQSQMDRSLQAQNQRLTQSLAALHQKLHTAQSQLQTQSQALTFYKNSIQDYVQRVLSKSQTIMFLEQSSMRTKNKLQKQIAMLVEEVERAKNVGKYQEQVHDEEKDKDKGKTCAKCQEIVQISMPDYC